MHRPCLTTSEYIRTQHISHMATRRYKIEQLSSGGIKQRGGCLSKSLSHYKQALLVIYHNFTKFRQFIAFAGIQVILLDPAAEGMLCDSPDNTL